VTTWSSLRNAIKAAVRTAATDAGAVAAAVAWSDEQRPTAKLVILLDVVSATSLHDRSTSTPITAGATQWALSSMYHVNLQVRAEKTDAGPAVDALFALEALRASLHRPSLVLAEGAALVWPLTQRTDHVSFEADGRVVSSYSFEVGVRAVLDFTPAETGYTVRDVLVEGEQDIPNETVDNDFEVVAP
jgi:hypothetical protein